MANGGTVAPKERVKITYKPDIGDAAEEREIPMRMLVLGDFTGSDDDTPIEDRQPINVDKSNFDEVMRGMNLSLDLQVANELADKGGENLNVHLELDSTRDFGPDAIAQQIPELRKLQDLRNALVALKGPLTNDVRFRKALQRMLDDEDQRFGLLDELMATETTDDNQ